MEEIKVSEMLQADSINKDDSVMIIQEGVNKKASGSIQTATGTSLSLTSVADTCKVKSNSKNLYNNDNPTILTDIYVSPTNNVIGYVSGGKSICIPIKASTTYTISKSVVSARFVAGTTPAYPSSGDACSVVEGNNTGTTITITTGASDKYLTLFYFLPSQDTSITEDTIRAGIQIEEGSTATSYNPYNTEVKVCGKNLFDQSQIVNPPAGSVTPSIILTLKPNTAYTMSTNCVKSVDDTTLIFFASGTSSTGLSTAVNGVWNGQTRTFTSDSNGHMIVVYLRNARDTNTDLTDYWYQIEEGSTATTYEKFEGQYLNLIPDETKTAFTYDSLTNVISDGNITIEYNAQSRLLNNDDVLDIAEPVKEYVDRKVKTAPFSGTTNASGNLATNISSINKIPLFVKETLVNNAFGCYGFIASDSSNVFKLKFKDIGANTNVANTNVAGIIYYIDL